MSYTKRQFVEGAFEELGLASYTFDLSAEDLNSALRRLDSMMAEWNGRGIRIGYPLPTSPDNSVISDPTNVPDVANEAIRTNLALRIAPSFGKTVSRNTELLARSSFLTLQGMMGVKPPVRGLSPMQKGAGNVGLINSPEVYVEPGTVVESPEDSLVIE